MLRYIDAVRVLHGTGSANCGLTQQSATDQNDTKRCAYLLKSLSKMDNCRFLILSTITDIVFCGTPTISAGWQLLCDV